MSAPEPRAPAAERSASVGQALALVGGARVLFTDRTHGDLSSGVGEDAERGGLVRERDELAHERLRLRIGVARLARGRQVHGAFVRRVDRIGETALDDRRPADADGQATELAGVGLMVLGADCLPVALARAGAVAIVHAGWRGLAAGVLEAGVRALGEPGRGEVVAVLGPCAGVCCYEVGPEVHAALACGRQSAAGSRLAAASAGVGSRLAGASRAGRSRAAAGHVDLRSIARERLLAAGVADVRDVAACTICDERFFSHRREGARAGRQAGVAWLS